MNLTTENTSCIIVDIQDRLLPALYHNHVFIEKCRIAIQGLTALDIPMVITEQYPQGLGYTTQAVKLLLPDAPVFEKTRFSAWLPEIKSFLEQRRAENVILIGAETHVCILQTALDLRENNFNVYLPFQCTTSRDLSNKDNALNLMTQNGVVIGNIESLLFQLLRDAKHPAFKTISKLIR